MRVEVAVVKMLDAARDSRSSPKKLARLLSLAITKVAHINPNGDEALKIIQNDLMKSAMSGRRILSPPQDEIPSVPKQPRKRGRSKRAEAVPS